MKKAFIVASFFAAGAVVAAAAEAPVSMPGQSVVTASRFEKALMLSVRHSACTKEGYLVSQEGWAKVVPHDSEKTPDERAADLMVKAYELYFNLLDSHALKVVTAARSAADITAALERTGGGDVYDGITDEEKSAVEAVYPADIKYARVEAASEEFNNAMRAIMNDEPQWVAVDTEYAISPGSVPQCAAPRVIVD